MAKKKDKVAERIKEIYEYSKTDNQIVFLGHHGNNVVGPENDFSLKIEFWYSLNL